MAYRDFADLPRRTASDKVLSDKAFNITKNPKYDRYKKGLASMVSKCFSKKSSATRGRPEYLLELILQIVLLHVLFVYISTHDKSVIRNKIISSQKLAENYTN